MSDLVVPVALAEVPGSRAVTGGGVRLADDTWLRADLLVCRDGQADGARPDVEGPPLLAVEVVSPASRDRDLGAKKDMYERFGVPHYWVVDPTGAELWMHVYELADGGYAEQAKITVGEAHRVTAPFPLELAPEAIFDRTSRWTSGWKGNTMERTGPDLPSCEEPILIDSFGHRWPTGAEKVELEDGCPIFYGEWDERDVTIAERTYPGRVVRLDQPAGEPGTITILPGPEPAA
ncbi:putative restriction endonuclease [Thermomonospora umbrina]|uniref:Putative restriction endonuclease n=1 Tax=Thermomonospora umbrina TaxID=111806 RepID=A0A3D9SU37_9ACTN|nr:putative restriction endonuclease [Thermomonospora umbrina]